MPSALKERAQAAVGHRRKDIVDLAERLWQHPETGFREHATAAIVAETLRSLGMQPREGLAITGVRATLESGRPGPTVAVLGELDALPVPEHPAADPTTGAAHACGHHAQLTQMLGVAMALHDADAMGELAGRVAFIAVPAEEYVELDWRQSLAASGQIEFLGGKAELVRLGIFDDVDMALFLHATATPEDRKLSLPAGSNGFITKRARFEGRSAHAAAAPHAGVNALNAATLALSAIAMQRETFRDADAVRVHSILTRGGSSINVVPADVRVDVQVRSRFIEALDDAAAKVDRSLRAGALAVGAAVEIETLPGYLPLVQDPGLGRLFRANAIEVVGIEDWVDAPPFAASTDAGDLSHLMPLVHPSAGGFGGTIHGATFHVESEEVALIDPVRALVGTVVDLLADDAAQARQILAAGTPRLTRDEYLHRLRDTARTERFEGC